MEKEGQEGKMERSRVEKENMKRREGKKDAERI